MIITSKTNNIVKYICSLDNKKYRNKYNKYVIEGIKMVEEIINSEGYAPEFIIYSKEILQKTTIGTKFIKNLNNNMEKCELVEVSEDVFKYISKLETPQGVMAVIDKKEYNINDLEKRLSKENNDKYIIIDRIQDPGNLGTIIRSAVSFETINIIYIEGTVDPFSSKVIRSSMSAMFKINLFCIKEDEIEKAIQLLKSNGYKILATSLKGEKYINEESIDNNAVFVMGNEASGVSEDILNICDTFVKIPMSFKMESLNVAVASSIVMYEQYIRGEKDASQARN